MTMMLIISAWVSVFPFSLLRQTRRRNNLQGGMGLFWLPSNGPKVGKTSRWWECSIERLLSLQQLGNSETAKGQGQAVFLKGTPKGLTSFNQALSLRFYRL